MDLEFFSERSTEDTTKMTGKETQNRKSIGKVSEEDALDQLGFLMMVNLLVAQFGPMYPG